LLYFLCTIQGGMAAGLPEIEISKNFNQHSLTELIHYIEARHNVKFYYKKEQTDSINVVQQNTPSFLEIVIKESLQYTKLNYFADIQGNIFLTFQYTIESKLHPSLLFSNTEKTTENNRVNHQSSFLNKFQSDNITVKEMDADLIVIGIPEPVSKTKKVILSGYVSEKETGNPVVGAVIYVDNLGIGTITDMFGYYVLTLPQGTHDFLIKYLGRKDKEFGVQVYNDGKLNISLEERLIELRDVVITARKEQNVRGLQIGLDKIEIQTIKQLPSNLGEADIIKSALLLPGVQTVGEGASGFNVRGGNTDQNLILLDGAPLFNTSHMFGFFSIFNPDIVRDFKLYKSGIPAKYGGRLSSVFDVSVKNGDLRKTSLNGGISPVAGRLSIDGPIIKDRMTFLLSGRGSYSDWLLSRIDVPSLKNSKASFYDLNTKINFKINENNEISISAYSSEDYFKLNFDTLYNYKSNAGNIDFKHYFSKKLYGIFSGIYSKYTYHVKSEAAMHYAFDLNYQIDYKEAKADFTWFLNTDHRINYGANIIRYNINPGTKSPIGPESLLQYLDLPDEKGIEIGLFLSDEFRVSDYLSVSYGLRYSSFLNLGPAAVYHYLPEVPKSIMSRNDSSFYRKNSITKDYNGIESRFTARYITSPSSSVKVSIGNMNQYLHMLSNTTAISPTDIWKLSGTNLPPQRSWQYSAGFYKDILSNTIEASAEIYFKKSKDILEYRGGTYLLMNPELEVDLLQGVGNAYGLEVLFRKKFGALNGWVSYTYSRSLIKVDNEYLINQINQGNYFPSNYDKPHDFTLVANYRFSRRHSLSSTLTHSTGRPITFPVAKYQFRNRELMYYSNRNEYRLPDYFRWDISANIEGNLKAKKRIHDSVSISVYNITGRNNAYSVFFLSEKNRVKGYKLSVFSRPILSATYNFKF
jgi:hypothetical protein